MLDYVAIVKHILAILSALYFNELFKIYSYTFYISSAFIAESIS